MKESSQAILTPLVSLDTPGKATVEVVIVADPVSVIALETNFSCQSYLDCIFGLGKTMGLSTCIFF